MIFRSQDGRNMVNADVVDTFSIVKDNKAFKIYAYRGAEATWLGEYTTEKQALEVMGVMQKDLIEGGAVYRLSEDKGAPYECPVCHNTEHLPGAKFCMVCGNGFPLSREGGGRNGA